MHWGKEAAKEGLDIIMDGYRVINSVVTPQLPFALARARIRRDEALRSASAFANVMHEHFEWEVRSAPSKLAHAARDLSWFALPVALIDGWHVAHYPAVGIGLTAVLRYAVHRYVERERAAYELPNYLYDSLD